MGSIVIPQAYPLWIVDGNTIRLIVGWERCVPPVDEYRPVTVSLGGPSCVAETELSDELFIYPFLEDAQNAVMRNEA